MGHFDASVLETVPCFRGHGDITRAKIHEGLRFVVVDQLADSHARSDGAVSKMRRVLDGCHHLFHDIPIALGRIRCSTSVNTENVLVRHHDGGQHSEQSDRKDLTLHGEM